MTDVVTAIRRVTDIMGEISAASHEQSSGMAQIGEAVTQMDQTTQQNAALVEEMAAAASSLHNQAQSLVEAVAVFKLSEHQQNTSAAMQAASVNLTKPATVAKVSESPPKPLMATKSPVLRRPVAIAGTQQATDKNGDDWETF
jgi:methyl-accepting chemotaxis protein